MSDNKTLFLLDAYALIYRSYYAFINNPRITTTGINTSATFGFANFLLELLELEKPTHIAVVFDPDGPTFRHEMYEAYKAQRPPMPEDLKKSVPYIKQIIQGMGISCIDIPGYEADDVIGTLAKKAEKEGYTVYMITPDKDYAQLVSEKVFMYKPGRSGNKSEVWGIPEVLDHFGIERVDQVIDILGLMGDTADNIPGCAGIGPKSASSLVYKYGDIDGIYAHINELKGKQKENLLTCQSTVQLSRTLVTICTEVPTDITTDFLEKKQINTEILEPIFKELELFSLSKRVFNTEHEKIKAEQLTDIKVDYQDYTQNIPALLELLEKVDAYALFTTFEGGTLYNSQPISLAFSTQKHTVCYINLPADESSIDIILRFKILFENKEKTLISIDAKNDIIWLKRTGIEVRNKIFDVKIAHYLLQPDMSHDLNRMALEYLNYKLSNGKQENQQLTLQFDEETVGDNDFCEKTDVIFQLKEKLQEELEKTGLWKLYNEIEMPLIFVLADMEYEGVCIDTQKLKEIADELKERCDIIEKEIFELAGQSFNVSSPKQLGEILFEKLKIDHNHKKTKSGQYSTSEQILAKLEDEHPIIGKILDYRGLKKLLSTYAEALPTFIDKGTGKIHTHFNQAEAATGRLSSLNPNLQNIPIRTEDGRKIRKAFVTGDDDYVFFSADYSQVELRLMAHLSQDKELINAFNHDIDVHTATASKIYHVTLEEVTPEMRRRAKTANFGIIYGISAWGLAERLHISRKEGKELIDGYFELYPGVKKYMETSVEIARKKEYVETIMGRRRYLRDINSRNAVVRGMAERNAINAPIQGSAADIIKMAMISIHRRIQEEGLLSRMILQVHDELNFKCHKSEQYLLKTLVTSCMEHVVKLSVPLTVSTGFETTGMKHTNFIRMYQTEKIQNSVQTDTLQNTVTDYSWPQGDISLLDNAVQLEDTFEICQPSTLPLSYQRIDIGKNISYNLFFTILFLGIFAVIRLRGKDLMTDIICAMAQKKRITNLLNEGILPNLLFYGMGLILSFSILAIFINYITTQIFISFNSLVLLGGLLLYHLFLLSIVQFLGWTFNTKQIANEFIINLWTFHISLGLLVSPFIMALFFVREKAIYPLIIATIICLSLLMIVKIVRWLAIFFYYKVSILYMILYLCALELLPLLFLYKAVV